MQQDNYFVGLPCKSGHARHSKYPKIWKINLFIFKEYAMIKYLYKIRLYETYLISNMPFVLFYPQNNSLALLSF
jgi:hypothetical protein